MVLSDAHKVAMASTQLFRNWVMTIQRCTPTNRTNTMDRTANTMETTATLRCQSTQELERQVWQEQELQVTINTSNNTNNVLLHLLSVVVTCQVVTELSELLRTKVLSNRTGLRWVHLNNQTTLTLTLPKFVKLEQEKKHKQQLQANTVTQLQLILLLWFLEELDLHLPPPLLHHLFLSHPKLTLLTSEVPSRLHSLEEKLESTMEPNHHHLLTQTLLRLSTTKTSTIQDLQETFNSLIQMKLKAVQVEDHFLTLLHNTKRVFQLFVLSIRAHSLCAFC